MRRTTFRSSPDSISASVSPPLFIFIMSILSFILLDADYSDPVLIEIYVFYVMCKWSVSELLMSKVLISSIWASYEVNANQN
jgi:hypothetical protein